MSYRPLPNCLTIRDSKINGLGLFASKPLHNGQILGVSHYVIDNETIRTPLGGFYNHSENPNCEKIFSYSEELGEYYLLKTIKEIAKKEELTVKYTFKEYKGHYGNQC